MRPFKCLSAVAWDIFSLLERSSRRSGAPASAITEISCRNFERDWLVGLSFVCSVFRAECLMIKTSQSEIASINLSVLYHVCNIVVIYCNYNMDFNYHCCINSVNSPVLTLFVLKCFKYWNYNDITDSGIIP